MNLFYDELSYEFSAEQKIFFKGIYCTIYISNQEF